MSILVEDIDELDAVFKANGTKYHVLECYGGEAIELIPRAKQLTPNQRLRALGDFNAIDHNLKEIIESNKIFQEIQWQNWSHKISAEEKKRRYANHRNIDRETTLHAAWRILYDNKDPLPLMEIAKRLYGEKSGKAETDSLGCALKRGRLTGHVGVEKKGRLNLYLPIKEPPYSLRILRREKEEKSQAKYQKKLIRHLKEPISIRTLSEITGDSVHKVTTELYRLKEKGVVDYQVEKCKYFWFLTGGSK